MPGNQGQILLAIQLETSFTCPLLFLYDGTRKWKPPHPELAAVILFLNLFLFNLFLVDEWIVAKWISYHFLCNFCRGGIALYFECKGILVPFVCFLQYSTEAGIVQF